MSNIKKLLDNLRVAQANTRKTKKKLAGLVEDLGIKEEQMASEKDLWEELNLLGDLPNSISASGFALSSDLVDQSYKLDQYIDQRHIDSLLSNFGSVSTALGSVAISGATISYPPDQLPKAYENLTKLNEQQRLQQNIGQRLKDINPALATEYDNVWTNLHTAIQDPTRSPMFLMREVITHIIHHYSPDIKVRNYLKVNATYKITRADRLKYIISKLNPSIRQTFTNQQKALLDIYEDLSKAHKPGTLDYEETKGYLYQADALVKLMLDSL